ncbi:MAG: histidine kinase [Clostridiales bacterium]|nr:histidine kinase [Clostridiales bacterium]
MKLRAKMLATYLLASSLVLMMIAAYGSTLLRQTVLADKTEGYDTYARQLCVSTRLVAADIEQSLFNVYQNAGLAELLLGSLPLTGKRLEAEQALRTMCLNSAYFHSMVAVDLAGNAYFGTTSITESAGPLTGMVLARREALDQTFTLWFVGEDGAVYLKKTLCDLTPLTFAGMLVTRVNAVQMKSTLGLDGDTDGATGVITREGALLLSAGGLTESQLAAVRQAVGDTGLPVSRELTVEGVPSWLTVRTDSRYGWRIVHLSPLSVTLRVSRAVSEACLISGLIAATVAVILGALMTHSLTGNVRRLLTAMTEVSEGHFDARVDVRTKDEIGQLAERFRWMQGRLRESTAQMVERATEKQQAEYELLELRYRSLQAQISPHFICNILSSVNSLALMGKGQEVSRLSVSASQYLRDNMNGAEQKFTSLRAEILHVQEYITIYRAVYGEENALTVDVPEALLDGRVPNLLLQPLVENALVHGGDAEARLIRVAARRDGNRLLLLVSDNGGAIDPDVIRTIRRASADPVLTRRMKGFGLRCVLQRLRLLYGADQSLDIQCEPGRESRIRIDIPWQSYAVKETEE